MSTGNRANWGALRDRGRALRRSLQASAPGIRGLRASLRSFWRSAATRSGATRSCLLYTSDAADDM
eukprot:2187514-Alexandrium_andersonii.AAC.1